MGGGLQTQNVTPSVSVRGVMEAQRGEPWESAPSLVGVVEVLAHVYGALFCAGTWGYALGPCLVEVFFTASDSVERFAGRIKEPSNACCGDLGIADLEPHLSGCSTPPSQSPGSPTDPADQRAENSRIHRAC